MNVMLFGAGASFGAGDIVPERPPLGRQLFAELARCCRGSWGSLPKNVADVFRNDFEAGMEVLWNDFSEMVPLLMQQMALYLIQFRPRTPGSTLYCALAREMKRVGATDRVLLSTLNYECVLEHALCGQGLAVSYGEFPSNADVTVWKLHGSCNFLPEGIQATRGITFTRGVIFDTAIRPTGDLNEVAEFCLGDNALPPVMCLFMRDKPTQVAASSVRALQARWADVVGEAERIVVVGVHPNAADAHLWNALASAKGVLLYVGDGDAFAKWAEKHRRQGKSEVVASTFEEGFDRLIAEIVR